MQAIFRSAFERLQSRANVTFQKGKRLSARTVHMLSLHPRHDVRVHRCPHLFGGHQNPDTSGCTMFPSCCHTVSWIISIYHVPLVSGRAYAIMADKSAHASGSHCRAAALGHQHSTRSTDTLYHVPGHCFGVGQRVSAMCSRKCSMLYGSRYDAAMRIRPERSSETLLITSVTPRKSSRKMVDDMRCFQEPRI